MISIIRFAIFFSIFAFGNCKNEQNKKQNYLVVPIRVQREPTTDMVEFQFNKTLQIEPISLKANETSFPISEENDDVKKFRNTIPALHQGHSQTIKISLEYREPERTEIKMQKFLHAFRDNSLDEVITIRIEYSRPQAENPMEKSGGMEAVVVPDQTPTQPKMKIHRMINKPFDDDDFENICDDDGHADKLLETALRFSKLGTHLILKGFEEAAVNPVDAIREIIAEKFELPHLEYNILQAKFIDDGLLFEMQTPKDVVEILSKKDSVDLEGLKLEPTTRSIFDDVLDIRGDF